MIPTHNIDFDAIVIGSGITGGWAAKELTEKGLKVLVLERGKDVKHSIDYKGEHKPKWQYPYQGKRPRQLYAEQYPIQSKAYAFSESNRHFFNNDKDNPYVYNPDKPFNWMRADGVGGRSILWGRQSYRWSQQDFAANQQDKHGIPWPISYKDLAPWYSHVERFAGISGQAEGWAHLPDGEFLPPMQMFGLEKVIKARLAKKAPDILMTIGRTAVLTQDHNGRAACHYCGPCHNGCSTGSYFSSQSSTLPAARATGNLTLLADSVVERLVYDAKTKKISEVKVINSQTKERHSYRAKLFFLCASAVGSTQILLNSQSEAFPDGLANRNDVLGRYLMDHVSGISALGIFLDNMDRYYSGNRPNEVYIPRFRNLDKQDADFVRGYGYQTSTLRSDWHLGLNSKGFGAELKESLRKPGYWIWGLGVFAECLPQKNNRMFLHKTKKDRFGIPQVEFDFSWGSNERAIWQDSVEQADRILKAAGAVVIKKTAELTMTGGTTIHEMGTARMGDDPQQSVLNAHNQAHGIANLFVTDGACMTSSACVNPSLTYMALTARACDYATKQLVAGNL